MTTELPGAWDITHPTEPLALKSKGVRPTPPLHDSGIVAMLKTRFEFMSHDGVRWYMTSNSDPDCMRAAAEIERLRGLLRLALPMLKEHADYANSAPVWHCTGYEANTLNAMIPEIEAVLGPNAAGNRLARQGQSG